MASFVRHYDNVFDVGDDLDKIVESLVFKPTSLGITPRVDTRIRSAQEINLTGAARHASATSVLKRAEYRIHQALWEVVKRYRAEFPTFDPIAHETITVLRYEKGQRYTQHVDGIRGNNRTLTVILGLNEGYEGGLLSFFDGVMDVHVGKGQALAFPSNYMFPHQAKAVTAGVRYSVVCWF